jgi:hypothetical protein
MPACKADAMKTRSIDIKGLALDLPICVEPRWEKFSPLWPLNPAKNAARAVVAGTFSPLQSRRLAQIVLSMGAQYGSLFKTL